MAYDGSFFLHLTFKNWAFIILGGRGRDREIISNKYRNPYPFGKTFFSDLPFSVCVFFLSEQKTKSLPYK
jgi:hypothetical protein